MRICISHLKEKLRELSSEPIPFALLLAAWVGLIIRAVYCFGSNPLDFLGVCDCQRHYDNALHLFRLMYSFLDQIGYQLWLAAMFSLFGQSKIAVAIFTGLLSMSVPYIWLLWLRECIPSKTAQLVGFAAISLLLPWITIYAFFMTEALLLPSFGLALWLTWRARRVQTFRAVILAAFAWAWVINVKMIILPEAVIAMAWLFVYVWKIRGRRSFIMQLLSASIVLSLALLITPILNMYGFGTTWLFPPGGIHAYANRVFLLSGARHYRLEIYGPNGMNFHTEAFEAGALNDPDQLLPFIHWTNRRTGCVTVNVTGMRGISLLAPSISKYLALRPDFMRTQPWFIVENTAAFFFACEWPDCTERDFLQRLQSYTRWFWAPMFLLTIALASLKRRCNIIVVMSVVTALCFCLQDWGTVGGRYRKPWEGLIIVGLISLISGAKSSNNESAPGFHMDVSSSA